MIKEQNKQRKKHIVSLITSFFLFLLITLMMLLIWTNYVVLNSSFINYCMEKSNYKSAVYQQFLDDAKDIILPSGLSSNTVEDIVTQQQISADTYSIINYELNGQAFSLNTERVEENFQNNVKEELKTQGKTVSADQQAILEEYSTQIAQHYESTIKLPLISYIGQAKKLINKVSMLGMIVCGIAIVVCAVILIKMRHYKHRGIRYITYSLIAVALTFAIPSTIALISQSYKKLQIKPIYLNNLLTEYVYNNLLIILLISAFTIILSLILMIVTANMRKKKMHI